MKRRHEASVGTKVKDIDMNSVSDTSNNGNNCLNKKMGKVEENSTEAENISIGMKQTQEQNVFQRLSNC